MPYILLSCLLLLVSCTTTPKRVSSRVPGNNAADKSVDGVELNFTPVLPRFRFFDETVYVVGDNVYYRDVKQSRQEFLEIYESIQQEMTGIDSKFVVNVFHPINNKILDGESVSIVVVFASKVLADPGYRTDSIKSWIEAGEMYYNERLIQAYGGGVSVVDRSKFSVVDRSKLDEVLKEQRLSLTGITQNKVIQVGKLIEANHILFIDTTWDFSINVIKAGGGASEFKKIKLMHVPTGEILGTYAYLRTLGACPTLIVH